MSHSQCMVAYHKGHEHGPFNGTHFHVSRDAGHALGRCVYVIEGRKSDRKVLYFLVGRYLVSGQDPNPYPTKRSSLPTDKEFQVNLKAVNVLESPILLNGQPDFDDQLFHDNFTSGQGNLPRISPKTESLAECFERLLGPDDGADYRELETDLADIENDAEASETDRLELRKARIGQGKFKTNTIKMWGGEARCALTGISIPELLIASHIRPWRESNNETRLAGWNGIILCSHVDRLFDKHLLGFKRVGTRATYNLEFSRTLKEQKASLEKIGINTSLQLDLDRQCNFGNRNRLEQMLEEHFERVRAK